MQDLKRKLMESEKRYLHLWEHVKDNNQKYDNKLSDFQQILNHFIQWSSTNQISTIHPQNDNSDQLSKL